MSSKKPSNLLAAITYAVGDLLTKGAKFILLPLYLYYFSAEEIGALAILQAVSLGLTPLFTNGISMAVARFYQEYEPRSEQLVATLLVISLVVSGIGTTLFAALFLFLPFPRGAYFATPIVLAWLLSGFLRANSTILERRYVIRGEAMYYRSLTFAQFAFSTAIIFVLVIFTDMKLLGIAIGECLAYGITLAYLGVSLLRKWKPDFGIIRSDVLWRYTYPLAGHAIFVWALSYADRLVLGRFVGLAELGVYHIGYVLATIMSTVALSIKNAWLPDFFRLADEDKDRGEKFSTWLASYYQFILLVAAGMICLGPPLATPFLQSGYLASLPIMKWVVIALIPHAMMVVLLNPLYHACRTKTIAAISASALIVNVVAMYTFIPLFGISGAAMASVLAYGTAAIATYHQASREYTLNMPWARMMNSTVAFLLIVFVSTLSFGDWFESLACNSVWLILYLAAILFTPGVFITPSDRDRILAKIRFRSIPTR